MTAAASSADRSRQSGRTGTEGARRWPTLMDLGLAVLATLLAMSGMASVYAQLRWFAIGTAGALVAAAVGHLAMRLGASILTTLAAALVAAVVLAGPIALPETTAWHLVPSVATGREIGGGVVRGWRELLTTAPPVAAAGRLAVLPYLCGFVGTLGALILATRTRRAALPLLPPAVVAVTAVLMGTGEPAALLVQGAAFTATGIGWAAVRSGWLRGRAGSQRPAVTRLAAAVVMLVVAGGIGYGGGGLTGGLDRHRYVLRDHIERPFDQNAFPSPLAGFRRFEVALKDKPLFQMSGLPAGARIQLATMDSYDGLVWSVSASGASAGSGVFERIGAKVSGTTIGAASGGSPAQLRVSVGDLDGVWLPIAGQLRRMRFGGQRSNDLSEAFRYNRSTGVGVEQGAVRTGDEYVADVVVGTPAGGDQLAGRRLMSLDLPRPVGVPEIVSATATEWTAGIGDPLAQLTALSRRLRAGAFSDGTVDADSRSRPGHGAGRIRDFLAADQLVGDGEQYAAAMGLMARALGLPARVVLGVVPPQEFTGTVTGAMVSAWVEVPVDGVGWVAFDPTPPPTNRPQPPRPQDQPEGSTQVVQPPVAQVIPPPQLPPPDSVNETDNGSTTDGGHWLQLLITIAVRAGVPLLGIGLILGGIALAKAGRRRRRRDRGSPRNRVAGGWAETLDRLHDLGMPVSAAGTRSQVARQLAQCLPAGPVADPGGTAGAAPVAVSVLASTADLRVFGPDEPSDEAIGRYWDEIEQFLATVAGSRSRLRRVTAPINPASLRLRRLPGQLASTWHRVKGIRPWSR